MIANYQKPGLFEHDHLEILKPVRQQNSYALDSRNGELKPLPTDANHAFRHRLMGAVDAN